MEIQADVFVVEDDQLLASALSVQIETLGYRVTGTAANAASAVDAVLACPPRVILMDINLIGSATGLDAAKDIRRECDVPIIFYTAYGDGAVRQQVAQIGNACLLQKPVPEEALERALADSLRVDLPSARVRNLRRSPGSQKRA